MGTSFTNFAKIAVFCAGIAFLRAQDVITTGMATSDVKTIYTRIQHATLIQLPVEPLATSVGDPNQWLVEKQDRWISIKPIVPVATETSLGIITRMGTLNFTVKPVSDKQNYTQNIRITNIIDDSKILPQIAPQPTDSNSRSKNFVNEIQVAKNYFFLLKTKSEILKDVQQFTMMFDTSTPTIKVSLLQTFRFLSTRDVLLHFTITNKSNETLELSPRNFTASFQQEIFSPLAVSLGSSQIPSGKSTENFLILDGKHGLNPSQNFEINMGE